MRLAIISVILLVTCINIIDYTVAANEMTFHVSSMVGSEDTYLQLKRRKPSLRRPGEEKLRYKEDICLAILADEFFDAHKVEMVNPNHKTIYKQVKQNHPDIHDEHFKTGFSSEVIKPKFANPYKPRDVNVDGHIVREYMFTCLAKNCSTKNIQQYFVSPEYVEGSAKTVRFVFAYNKKKELVLTAKAEKNSDSPRTETTSGVTGGATKAKSVETTEEPTKESEESSSYDEDDESDSW